jgi:DNA polymerase-1
VDADLADLFPSPNTCARAYTREENLLKVSEKVGKVGAQARTQACDLGADLAPTFEEPAKRSAVWESDPPDWYIRDADGAQAVVTVLLKEAAIGLDCETTGLDPHKDTLRLVTFAGLGGAWVIDVPSVGIDVLLPLLGGGPVKVAHNAGFDMRFLLGAGIKRQGPWWDTMIADQLLRNAGHGRKLSELAKEYLGQDMDKTLQTSDWSGPLTSDQLDYAVADANVLLPLYNKLSADLETAGMTMVTSLEMRALPAVVAMEHRGLGFDLDAWTVLAREAEAKVVDLAQKLTALATGALEATDLVAGRRDSWDSPKQVLKILHELGMNVDNTNEETLQAVKDNHPIVPVLLEYREQKKRAGTYGVDWLKHVNPVTGRIHASWAQVGAESGRMACSRPNLQSLPRDPRYRACFSADPGTVKVAADYSQIELRIMAQMSQDKKMLEAFGQGEDLHKLTASLVTGKAPADVTAAERQVAKAVNFGLIYGMGFRSLVSYAKSNYGVEITDQEAAEFRRKFFSSYRGVARWHYVHKWDKETRTLLGRRRLMGREASVTLRYNSPVQGTGADLLKLAMALLWEIPGPEGAALVQSVHDELVVEAPEGQSDEAREWLVTAMQKAVEEMLTVPVVVESK